MIFKPGETESDALKALARLTPKNQETLRHINDEKNHYVTNVATDVDKEQTRIDQKYSKNKELQRKLTEILRPYLTGPVSKKSSGEYISEFITSIQTMKIVKTTEGVYLESKLGTNFLYQKIERITFEELQAKIEEAFKEEEK